MKICKRALSILLAIAMLTAFLVPVQAEDYKSISLNESVSVEATETFVFVPETDGMYIFESSDYDEDPKVTVYDDQWEIISADDDSGLDWNFRVYLLLVAGQTYYLEAGGAGSYQVTLTQPTFQSIGEDEVVSVDQLPKYFAFTPETNGVYVFASQNSDQSPEGSVYDPAFDVTYSGYSSDNGSNFQAPWGAQAGRTYYLTAEGTGSYQVKVSKDNSRMIDPGDTVSVAAEGALYVFTPATSGVYAVTALNCTAHHWFDITTADGGYVSGIVGDDESGEISFFAKAGEMYFINAGGDVSFNLTLKTGKDISIGETVSALERRVLGFTAENNGTYIFSVTGCQSYCNVAVFNLDEEYLAGGDGSEDFEVSVSVKAGESYFVEIHAYNEVQVTLTEKKMKQLTLGQTLDVEAVDMFIFVPEESGPYTFCSTEYDGDPRCSVYDSDMNLLVSNDDGGDAWNFAGTWMAEAGETYYLSAEGYGTYRVYLEQPTAAQSMSMNYDRFVGDPAYLKEVWLYCRFEPEDTYGGIITWTSSDESVAVVDQGGNVQIVGTGTTVITATSSLGFEASCTVEGKIVPTLTLNEGLTCSCMDALNPFTFTPTEDGTYCFYSEGDVDTYVDLFDEDQNILLSSDDYEGNINFCLIYDLVAGKPYYLRAGNYEDQCDQTYQVKVKKVAKVTGIQLSQTEVVGEPEEYIRLEATLLPDNAMGQIFWQSSDTEVAMVDSDGIVYCCGEGTAVITATTSGGVSASCTVTVAYPEGEQLQCDQPVNAPIVTEKTNWFKFVPETDGWYRFSVQCDDADWVTYLYDENREILLDGTGYYSALSYEMTAGKTYYYGVNFYYVDEGAQCTVLLEKPPMPTGITLNRTTATGYVDSEIQLESMVAPDNSIPNVTWTSSDESIALVEDGEVRILDMGTVVITATTVNGLTASCTITVIEPETIDFNEPLTLNTLDGERWFYFTPKEDGWYGIYSTGDCDPYAGVYDAQGDELAYNDDSGVDANFLVRCQLEAGQTYKLRCNSYDYEDEEPGTYQVHLEKLQKAQEMTVSYSNLTLFADDMYYLEVEFQPILSLPESVTWTSDNEAVAIIEEGEYETNVYAVAPGTATLTAISENGLTTTISLKVVSVPEGVDDYGICGEDLIWYQKDGVLTIEGSGDMFPAAYFRGDVTQVNLPEQITSIGSYAFCLQAFETITIPAAVKSVGYLAFAESALQEIWFLGSAPVFDNGVFENVSATVYYPADDPSWEKVVGSNWGGELTWVPYGGDDTTDVTLSGNITTGTEGVTTLTLTGANGTVTTTVSGKTGTYSFANVAPGTYTLVVTKANHVTGEYTVTVGSTDLTQDVKICMLGDVDGNGKINVGDISKLLAHVRGTTLITDEYLLTCANVNGGKLNMGDISTIYAHLKGTKPLY